MIVTSPLSATSIVASAGNVGFAVLTASFTAVFSSSVNFAGLSTLTLFSGAFGVTWSAVVGTTDLDTSPLGFLSASFCTTFTSASLANGVSNATSHLPFCPTVAVFLVPSGNVTSIVAPATPVPLTFVSSVSTLSTVGVAEAALATTVWAGVSLFTEPSAYWTSTVPSFFTSIVASAGNVGFAVLTASFTAVFSAGVKSAVLSTSVVAGAVNGLSAATVLTTAFLTSGEASLSFSFWTTFTSASLANGASNVTSHLLFAPTVAVFLVPSGNVTSIVAPATPVPVTFVSSVSTLSNVGSADVARCATVLVITSLYPSGYVTVTSPLSPAFTVVPAGNVGFLALNAVSTFVFSSSVNDAVLSTVVTSGCVNVTRVVKPTGFNVVSATLVNVGTIGSVVVERFSLVVPVVKRLVPSAEISLTV